MPDGDKSASRISGRAAIAIAIVLGFVAVVAWSLVGGASSPTDSPTSASDSITSVHNDAVSDYEQALTQGKPIYVLFHSLSCAPCVEISEVVDTLFPEYEDEVTFVNAISDDPAGRELATRFAFQYIPTSFFLAPDGTVIESFTGSMDEAAMRVRLDNLCGSAGTADSDS